jgi:hypothetical protein
MSEIKTKINDGDVSDFISSVDNEQKKKDGFKLLEIFTRLTGEKPKLWGNTTSSFIGFGQYHYKSDRSSQEGDWPLTGFSPKRQKLTLYLMHGFDKNAELLSKLGKHKASMGCLYINKLDDVDMKVLEELIKKSYEHMKKENS